MPATVLVVEDDPRTSASVALYLRHAGYEVVEATDGVTALQAAADCRDARAVAEPWQLWFLRVRRGRESEGDQELADKNRRV